MSRIRVAIGSYALEYEGEEEFGLDGALNFFRSVLETTTGLNSGGSRQNDTGMRAQPASTGELNLSASTIAARLGVGSGAELILAACLYLEMTLLRTSYDRKEIVEAMRNGS